MLHLILGGARSGKSRYAEEIALAYYQQHHCPCHYLATATALDEEMRTRIAKHQQTRINSSIPWLTHEVPLDLSDALNQIADSKNLVLVDCLTLWLTNQLLNNSAKLENTKKNLLKQLTNLPGNIILVSNEVGSGIVPLGELSRQFVDEAGWLNQSIAQIANKVTLVVAGLPLSLKCGQG